MISETLISRIDEAACNLLLMLRFNKQLRSAEGRKPYQPIFGAHAAVEGSRRVPAAIILHAAAKQEPHAISVAEQNAIATQSSSVCGSRRSVLLSQLGLVPLALLAGAAAQPEPAAAAAANWPFGGGRTFGSSSTGNAADPAAASGSADQQQQQPEPSSNVESDDADDDSSSSSSDYDDAVDSMDDDDDDSSSSSSSSDEDGEEEVEQQQQQHEAAAGVGAVLQLPRSLLRKRHWLAEDGTVVFAKVRQGCCCQLSKMQLFACT